MLIAPGNKVDLTSWHITVHHPWEPETDDHWDNPSAHLVMREVLHEAVHFWQAVGTPYLLRLSVGVFRDFLLVRDHALRQSRDGQAVAVDRLQLEDNRHYFGGLFRLTATYGSLSAADLIEGLARYWDIHLCGARAALERLQHEGKVGDAEIQEGQLRLGPFFLPDGVSYSHHLLDFVFEYEARYNRAYRFASEQMGREAFILFPILGFFALSAGERSVSTFQRWVRQFAETRPFEVPRGHFLIVWDTCFRLVFEWIASQLGERVYSALTAYARLRRRMMAWSVQSTLATRFGLVQGHGVLDRYLGNYAHWMQTRNPDTAAEDIELHFDAAFALPGHPLRRRTLTRHFHPPVVFFRDGQVWRDEANWPQPGPQPDAQLPLFGAMVGATMALTGDFNTQLRVRCPHAGCPWHRTGLCWKVEFFPADPADCPMPSLYHEQLLLALPEQPEWHAGLIDRAITRERDRMLEIELD